MHRLSRPGSLPAVGRLLNEPGYARLRDRYPQSLITDAVREQLDLERGGSLVEQADVRLELVEARLADWSRPRLVRVINGTGVVLHTNLGRAPLSPTAAQAVASAAAFYSNTELDLKTGRRGERGALVAELLERLTGAGASLVVNNNAAAILLALSALCRGREVIVSRGQQVEIGGSFRMPDVMRLSGARMVEVGTTNRTRAADYEDAITARTAAILRVHTSNYQVTGFVESTSMSELAELARRHSVLLIDDLGSGALEAVAGEPTVAESVLHADVVTFSGDKLLGGPQAGIVLGRPDAIRKMAKHPLARAVRIDKLTLAGLEATLRDRLLGLASPVQSMLVAPPDLLRRRAGQWLVKLLEREIPVRLVEGESAVGGGSLPGHVLPTWLMAIEGPASKLALALRRGVPPVLARIESDLCCIDPRAVLRGEDELLVDAIEAAYLGVDRR